MALLLDISNILGGLLLAVPVLRRLPAIGYEIGRFADRIASWTWVIGIAALVGGGYYLIVHVFSGPRVFHFEVVGLAVGLALLWERLTGRKPLVPVGPVDLSGRALLVSVFGLIAVVVGIQGLFTPD